MQHQITFSRPRDTVRRRGVSRSQHYADMARGLFTKSVRIGKRAAGHPDHEIEIQQAARLRGATDDELRALVRELEAARTAA